MVERYYNTIEWIALHFAVLYGWLNWKNKRAQRYFDVRDTMSYILVNYIFYANFIAIKDSSLFSIRIGNGINGIDDSHITKPSNNYNCIETL